MENTSGEDYARRLQAKQEVWWKKALNVQAPYQWNLRRQHLGRTLDVGCGIGRNLETLDAGSVGVDHNAHAVEVARERGLTALTVAEWESSALRQPESFDGMLLSHVIEHMGEPEAVTLLRNYLPYLRPGGRAFFVCPQERGYASDPTHVRFATGDDLARLSRAVGLEPQPWFSFPFPRFAGKPFVYNEFCLLAVKPE
ncbi:MAG: class SAM-dependent methyltransferase [Marmoricola sp.]|jgi:2-polyprenyl-3-methyl-5-hydroxy-6-metoxy-1,4-benzoquinol methylase|nr:class SAM-dependent methyltransferase [Marmoricola sp.]MCW2820560.1 class SAM-dependent methyltransferase [Marmoricola sp.]